MQFLLVGNEVAAGAAAASHGIEAAGNDLQPLHYGVLLAKSVGMPAHIADRARQIAEALEADQQQRVEHCSRESQAMRQVCGGERLPSAGSLKSPQGHVVIKDSSPESNASNLGGTL